MDEVERPPCQARLNLLLGLLVIDVLRMRVMNCLRLFFKSSDWQECPWEFTRSGIGTLPTFKATLPARFSSVFLERTRCLRCYWHEVELSLPFVCSLTLRNDVETSLLIFWSAWCDAAGGVAIPCRLGNRLKRLLLWAERKYGHCPSSVSVLLSIGTMH
jgi:hypothetical protein